MAESIAIKITNLPQIKAAFGQSPRLMTYELNNAIKKSILTIQAKSMKNTPVLTSRLRGSHRSVFGNLKGEVGTHTNYDIYVHEGTRYMKARPYLKLAVGSSGSEVEDFFTRAVDNVLSSIGAAV